MSYYVTHNSQRGLYLRRSSTLWLFVPLGLLFGGGALVAGFVLWQQGTTHAWGVGGVGVLMATWPLFMLKLMGGKDPDVVVFDDTAGMITWRNSHSLKGDAYTCYRDIEGVECTRQSSNVASSGTTTHSWEVGLRTRHGGVLPFASFVSEGDARALAGVITSHLNNGGGPEFPPSSWPRWLERTITGDGVTLSWTVKTGLLTVVMVLLFFGVWFGFLSFFDSVAPADLAPIPLTLIMRGVGAFVLVALLWNLLRSQSAHTLTLTSSRAALTIGTDVVWTLPFSDIDHVFVDWERGGDICFGHTTDPANGAPGGRVDSGILGQLRQLLKPRGEPLQLAHLSMVDRVNLANSLQYDLVQLRAGRIPSEPIAAPRGQWWHNPPGGSIDPGIVPRLVAIGLMVLAPGEWLVLIGAMLLGGVGGDSGGSFTAAMRGVMIGRLLLGMAASPRLLAAGDRVWGLLVVGVPMIQLGVIWLGDAGSISVSSLLCTVVAVVGGIRLLRIV